jgi:short-subunit dehydrogenase
MVAAVSARCSMKRIFLTGASSGIGLATAKALTTKGYEVWGTARDEKKIPVIQGLHPIALELGDRDSIAQSYARALDQAGSFDVLINNAGSGYFGPAELLSPEELSGHFQVLVFGQIELMHLALQSMRNQGYGLVINVTSLASRLPVPYMAAYNAAKAALASYTMSVQLELPKGNVRLVDLQPADINTSFNDVVARAKTDDARVDRVWQATDRNMKAAPKPELVAMHILKLIERSGPPPRLTVGASFQAAVAPLIFRFLPQRLKLWGLKNYYGI